jgi:energy-coupling factor transport system permease protein
MSLEFLQAFKFVKKDSFLYKMDPRAKLLLALVYTVLALLYIDIIPLFFILLTLLPIIILGKLMREWFKSIRGVSFLFVIILVLNTLFIYNKGFSYGVAMIIRITIMISSFSIFFLTVDPNDLALSLLSMKLPYEFAFSFSLAFRFVPTIANEAQNIMDAQMSRGYELEKKGIITQVKNLFPLLVPLIICSIRRAFNVAEALESRAFGSSKKRTFYFTIKYSQRDWLMTVYLLIIIIIGIIIRLNLSLMPSWFLWSMPI